MLEADRRLAGDGRGHRAVPARSHLRLSDHAADPYRRGPRRSRADRRARELRIHQCRERIRGAVGRDRRFGRGRARLYRDRQPGPAVHGRGRLQRRRPRPADRHDARQPRDRRADQHLERSFRRDGDARLRLDPAVRRDQPGSGRSAHRRLPPRRGTVGADDGLRRRLHPHPRGRADRHSRPGPGRRLSCRPTIRCRCSIPTTPSRSAPWSAPRLSPRCASRPLQAAAGLAADPARCPRISRRNSAARRAACCASYRVEDAETIVVAMGSVCGTIKDIDRRDARGRREDRRWSAWCPTARSRSRRSRELSPAPSMWWWSRRASPSASAARWPTMSTRPCATWKSRRSCIRPSRAWAAGRFRARARCTTFPSWRSTSPGTARISSISTSAWSVAKSTACARSAVPAPTAENILRQLALASQLPQG